MAIHEFIAGQLFDAEDLAILDRAFEGACDDLGVSDKTPHSRAAVAKTILEFSEGKRDPEAIRGTVVAFLKARH
jgi:hypothetical protein